MKRITLFTLSLLSVLLVASCSSSNDNENAASLKVEPKSLEFSKDGEAKTFKVTVNAGNSFTATKETTADWATITDVGDIVTVTTVANTTAETRTVRIVVKTSSGGLQDYVSISQAGTVDVFEVTPPTIEFTDLGGEDKITVTSTVADWTVEGSAAWLTLVPNLNLGEVKVTAKANTDASDRTVIIKIKRGTVEKPVTITQKAKTIEVEQLVLPYLTFGVAKEEVLKFETDRDHTYELVPDTQGYLEYSVKTLSTLMPKISLYFEPNYVESVVWNSIPKGETAKIEKFVADYTALLVEEGFIQQTEVRFYKQRTSDKANIAVTIYGNGVGFVLYKQQATFTEFPYGLMTWGVGETEIRAYEEANLKGIFDAENSKPTGDNVYMSFKPAVGDDQFIVRNYFCNKANYQDYAASVRAFTDFSKFAYIDANGDHTDTWTVEYFMLLESEGFKYYGIGAQGHTIFIKPAQTAGMVVAIYQKIFSDAVTLQLGEQKAPTAISPMELPSSIKSVGAFHGGKALKQNNKMPKTPIMLTDILK